MNKMLALFCMASLIMCSMSSISVQAVEMESCTEAVEPASVGLISSCNLRASNYNGSLCVNSAVHSPYQLEEIGVKNLTVQYSYDGSNWYNEWNSGNFLSYNVTSHTLSNYIISLERSGCYYRVVGTHYAKRSTFNTQSDSHTSNSVWIS